MNILRTIVTWIFPDAFSQPVQRPSQDHRIQVTLDRDSYRALDISSSFNATAIKLALINKVNFVGDINTYDFYYENEYREGTSQPLTDEDLVFICKQSDNSLTNRILVRTTERSMAASVSEPYSSGFRSPYTSPINSLESGGNSRYTPRQQNSYGTRRLAPHPISVPQIHRQDESSSSSQASNTSLDNSSSSHSKVLPRKGSQASILSKLLPDIPPSPPTIVPQTPSLSPPSDTTESSYVDTPVKKSSLWAIPPVTQHPQNVLQPIESQSKQNTQTTPVSFWAVQPRSLDSEITQKKNSNLWPTEADRTEKETALWPTEEDEHARPRFTNGVSVCRFPAEIGSTMEPISPIPSYSAPDQVQTSISGNLSPGSDEEEIVLWGERPNVGELYGDLGVYLPGHVLDNAKSTQSGSGSESESESEDDTPAKSMDDLSQEAHNNWKTTISVLRAKNVMLNRRSTIISGTKVQRIEPGMATNSKVLGRKRNQQGRQDVQRTRWLQGKMIGKGSFGEVYHAYNYDAKEWIAVKVVKLPKTISSSQSLAIDTKRKDIIDEICRESEVLVNVQHPNIVEYLGSDIDMEGGYVYMFIEYVPGGSLSGCLKKAGKFDEPLVRNFTRQILKALAYLHSKDILHRDIKGGNILIDNDGVCKIADFGLSKAVKKYEAYNDTAQNSLLRGTPNWMAPEVVKTGIYNGKADVWSLGCTVIEMLTGELPWNNFDNKQTILYNIGQGFAPPMPTNISDLAKSFIEKCLAIELKDRPSANELLNHEFVSEDPNFDMMKLTNWAWKERCLGELEFLNSTTIIKINIHSYPITIPQSIICTLCYYIIHSSYLSIFFFP
ncbi:kinase-like domain-containing protein [Phycomyces nitens]|nr:kinase-like domain-containing protein [Phycomyces nitens]